jgi:hypothetical protein
MKSSRGLLLTSSTIAACLALLLALSGCTKKEEPPGATAADETGRALSDMELSVSLRSGDPAPSNAAVVEATTEQLRFNGTAVIPLEKGRPGEKDADRTAGTIPKLVPLLKGQTAVAIRFQANVAYETMGLVLNTAQQQGISNAYFQVRTPGGGAKTGWINVSGYTMSNRAEDNPVIPGAAQQSWDAFTAKWKDTLNGCKTAQSGNCAYVDDNFAVGGTLKIELFSSGRGVNVDFYRRGLTAAQEEEEHKNRMKFLATKKEDFLQGRISHDDMVEILLLGDPSTQALFQFRYQEALESPSAITDTMAPVCHGSVRCGVVLAGDNVSPVMKMLTLLGAAFPDGKQLPGISFERSWTPRPKYVIPTWAAEKDPALEIALELGMVEE